MKRAIAFAQGLLHHTVNANRQHRNYHQQCVRREPERLFTAQGNAPDSKNTHDDSDLAKAFEMFAREHRRQQRDDPDLC